MSSVDSLLEQAGLLTDSLKAPNINFETNMPKAGTLSGRASVTDLDADLLGVKLDDCSRYFKKEIMVSCSLCSTTSPVSHQNPELTTCQLHQGRQRALIISKVFQTTRNAFPLLVGLFFGLKSKTDV